jgi:hypothetical protein
MPSGAVAAGVVISKVTELYVPKAKLLYMRILHTTPNIVFELLAAQIMLAFKIISALLSAVIM